MPTSNGKQVSYSYRRKAFFDSMPSSHLARLENLQPYHRTEDVVRAHGGMPHGIPFHLQDPQTLVWGPDDFPDGYQREDALVYGHSNTTADDTSWSPWPRV